MIFISVILEVIINKYLITISSDCGDSPDFANFRRPKPLQFPASSDDSARIISGEVTSRSAWPWQVRELL